LARLLDLWPTVAGARHVRQPGEVVPRLISVTRLSCRLSGSVKGSEPVWVVHLRAFVFRKRLGRLAALEQHVAEEFTCRHKAARTYRALFTRVLKVGGGAHETKRCLMVAAGKANPRRGAQTLHLNFDGPIGILRRLKRIGNARKLLHVALCSGR